MKMKFYNKVNPQLNEWINHYWHMSGELDADELYEVLPMDHSDIIVRIKGEFCFLIGEEQVAPADVFFQGLKTAPMYLKQSDYSETIGISFKPWGLYSLIPKPMSQFRDMIVDVGQYNERLKLDLANFSRSVLSAEGMDVTKLELILLKHLQLKENDRKSMRLIRDFIDCNLSVDEFIHLKGISRRTLERNFNKYVGVSPVKLRQIQKFEFASRELIFSEKPALSDLTYEGEYYDQSHFNKQFKKYSKKSPEKFAKTKSSLKSKIDYE